MGNLLVHCPPVEYKVDSRKLTRKDFRKLARLVNDDGSVIDEAAFREVAEAIGKKHGNRRRPSESTEGRGDDGVRTARESATSTSAAAEDAGVQLTTPLLDSTDSAPFGPPNDAAAKLKQDPVQKDVV
ncbi:unnamed protein product [Vitrella brassicaformis CCMP3155]|uniref:Uncharacterized protein n=1 Tax=Vitrella brassicaformis (strain CCMP3155) TaxID=1169540 RepID=A0A0G4FEY7_VITBC|nr:unnamed protein product [Vitrella brassicaformis CCMP3155]|eukprot:CEM11379.1 unnamed protein product [Vitrella brassicaformis CCMP3155]